MKTNFALLGDFRNVKLETPARMWAACARMVFGAGKPTDQLFTHGESGKICGAMYSKKIEPSQLMKSRLAEELGLTCEIDCPIDLGTVPPRLKAFGPHWIFNGVGQNGIFYGVGGDGRSANSFKLILASGATIEPLSDMKVWGRLQDARTFRMNVIFRNAPWSGGISDTTTYSQAEIRADEKEKRERLRLDKLYPNRNMGGGMKG